MGAVIKTIPQISQSHLSFDVVNANLVIIFTLVYCLEILVVAYAIVEDVEVCSVQGPIKKTDRHGWMCPSVSPDFPIFWFR